MTTETRVHDHYQDVNEGDGQVDSGLGIQKGDRLVITASGQIYAGVWLTGNSGPQGWRNIAMDPKFPMPSAHAYALLGIIDGNYFEIGNNFQRSYGGNGASLIFQINDDAPGNGSGGFKVHVEVWRPQPGTSRSPLQPTQTAWHSIRQDVYHNKPACNTGNNIEPENWRNGTGARSLCKECAKLP